MRIASHWPKAVNNRQSQVNDKSVEEIMDKIMDVDISAEDTGRHYSTSESLIF